eukprot:CAMPEP_0202864712 /NCGR_PEP_ID=MMETSP1391-20130828/4840_1 /ASSEMBLY_ACC=CAM_ASM_000867 /TAXON_ID=1034604 /ORGANISM="Chlamydomonas leiostraca, Strain SAG 11-49" /LENGTH=65 /DNA_ID=CAMNT_0049544481 /DNA_START=70 /DNA_END=267 /DNA_ORIENTATION=+
MGLFQSFSHAVYKETVLVWALGLYGSAVTCALVIPQFHDKRQVSRAKNPPTLKEVIAGVQQKLGH